MATEVFHSTPEPEKKQLANFTLLDALLTRRSRRFGKGMHLNGGPLAHDSTHEPEPLNLAEEAALAFAACGITGYTMAHHLDVDFYKKFYHSSERPLPSGMGIKTSPFGGVMGG